MVAPPRRSKRVAGGDASPVKPPAKKARLAAKPRATPKTDPAVKAPSPKIKEPSPEIEEAQNNDDEDEDSAEKSEDEQDGQDGSLSSSVKERLEYISEHVENLTNAYHRMIFNQFDRYMGSRSGNAQVANDIVNHCAMLAQRGNSDLRAEKRLVQNVYRSCFGSCGDSETEDEDYESPKEVQERAMQCMNILDQLPIEALQKVIKGLPKYKGKKDGDAAEVADEILTHLDELANKKADLIAELELIRAMDEEVFAARQLEE